ncbi:AP-4 complex subunit epsilon-1-like [Uloborus diversus]|uniref:AP-4 complex subunit epsilon-1-like n=1 Tax=Uloborus diversus TaxID=327109 RepID=UPI00240A511D|nr:AP-4 complex subunit epsilon-1-like [Uloborus diversus]
MARFVEKTFQSLNSVLNSSGLFQNKQDKSSMKLNFQWVLDLETFSNRLKNIDSKQDEEDIVMMYLSAMEKRLAEPDVTNVEIERMMKLCMVCETMGYSTTFIYIHSLKLAQKGNLQEKHTGYLAASYFLHPKHELVILLINTMQKDLCSSNYVEVLLALTSVCHLISTDTVHNVLYLVEEKLNHRKSSVRKLAILALGHCLQIANNQSSYQMSLPKLEKALTDPELEVVSVAVRTIYNIIQKLPTDSSYLINSLLELQEQILLRRIPSAMNYCDIPAPWLQIDILKLLSFLCKSIEHSEKIAPVLKKTLQQVGLNHTLAHAIMYQVVETATCVPMCPELSECVLSSVSMFLKSKDVNLKFIGIESLVLIMKKLKPSISLEQQETVMECLKLPDEVLQLKTLELLYQLANPSNVQPICKKMTEFLISVEDITRKKELAIRILHLASKYTERHDWYISTVNNIFSEAGNILLPNQILDVINIVVKDSALKDVVKKFFMDLIEKGNLLSSCSVKLLLSVLSTPSELLKCWPSVIQNSEEDLQNWIFTSFVDIFLKSKEFYTTFTELSEHIEMKCEKSKKMLSEFVEAINYISTFKNFDPDIKVDPTLTFLDSFVIDSLETNTACYLPPSSRLPLSTNYLIEAVLSGPDLEVWRPRGNEEVEAPNQAAIEYENNILPAPGSDTYTQNSENSSCPKSPVYNAFGSPSLSFHSLASEKEYSAPSTSKNSSMWTKEGRTNVSDEDNYSIISDTVNSKESEAEDDLHELFAGIS